IELAAAVHAFGLFPDKSLNIIVDSAYVIGIVHHLESAFIREVENKQLFQLLLKLAQLLKTRQHLYFIVHIHSHTNLPGLLTEGNIIADQLTMTVVSTRCFEQDKLVHDFFHQNAHSLWKHFSLTLEQAQEIVQACPDCQHLSPLPILPGTNP
ncbi:POK18 protein, partial [Nyctiprogne leucopyga]|nr:POK18 protein [Nyctiprogne leucopyga]